MIDNKNETDPDDMPSPGRDMPDYGVFGFEIALLPIAIAFLLFVLLFK